VLVEIAGDEDAAGHREMLNRILEAPNNLA
jgi:hypothetical protein